MPRKKKQPSSKPPKPRDTKTKSRGKQVKATKKAIARTKPPKAHIKRRKLKSDSLDRIKKLPILQDIVQWLREGKGGTEIARRIHDQGFCDDIVEGTLRNALDKYREVVVTPAELASYHMPNAVLDAAEKVKAGIDELAELEVQYRSQGERLAKVDQVIETFSQLVGRVIKQQEAKGPQDVAGMEVVDKQEPGGAELIRELQMVWKPDKTNWKAVPEAAAMSREDALLYLIFSSPAFDGFVKAIGHANAASGRVVQTLQASAEIKDMMGLLHSEGPSENEGVIEAEVGAYVKQRWRGKAEVQEVLTDPIKRNKILNVVEKLVTNKRLQRAIVAKAEGRLGGSED